MNNNPLPERDVRRRFEEAGYQIIKYTYKNNLTRVPCFDKDGYKVKVSLSSLRTNTNEYARFSPSCNEENFMFNLRHYQELHPDRPDVINWEYIDVGTQGKKQVLLTCRCRECGELFRVHLTDWKSGKKLRCNVCVRQESNLEIKVRYWLQEHDVTFVEQKKFDECRVKRPLPFDFYLPDYNTCIEVDGIQHFESGIRLHGHLFTKEEVAKIQERDDIKTKYCKDNGIKLIRLSYLDFRQTNKYTDILSKGIHN